MHLNAKDLASPRQQDPTQRSNTITEISNDFAKTFLQSTRNAINAEVPLGAWAAAAGASSKASTLSEIRKGSFVKSEWQDGTHLLAKGGRSHALSLMRNAERRESHGAESAGKSDKLEQGSYSILPETTRLHSERAGSSSVARRSVESMTSFAQQAAIPWTGSIILVLKAFWNWFITPFGFLVTIYALNVVAWGGMLFLLLCNAAPEMCWVSDKQHGWIRDCDALYSSRRIWLEIDSQILNALFCVTGFGLIPWRFRDLYYLLRWRLLPEKSYGRHQKLYGLRTLGGLYRNWVRLPGSDTLDDLNLEEYNAIAHHNGSLELHTRELDLPSVKANALDPRVPWKLCKTPPPPATGVRAPPTALWKIDFFIWCNVWNTLFQACLCGFMWGMSRFDRPSWSTGLFIALACIASGIAGMMSFLEGRKIRKIEGL